MWNLRKESIPIGTYFGPYRGNLVSPKDYSAAKESGYAWELVDSANKSKVVG